MSTQPTPNSNNIPAQLVKELRERTNAGFADCRAALIEAGGDIELAGTAQADIHASGTFLLQGIRTINATFSRISASISRSRESVRTRRSRPGMWA